MGLYSLVVLLVVFGLRDTAKAEENENTIDIQAPRRIEGKNLIPIDGNLQHGNIKQNENSENVTPVGQSKILMVIGHPKNDKVRLCYKQKFII